MRKVDPMEMERLRETLSGRNRMGRAVKPVGKRSDPSYKHHSFLIPGELSARMKVQLAGADRELSDVIEELVRGWVELREAGER